MYVVLIFFLALCLFLWLGLPGLLRAFGLHPVYRGPVHTLQGGRALVITTSH